MLQADKYNRSVGLHCPTCGNDQFEYERVGEVVQRLKCATCSREFSKDELIELNSENISEHINEMGKEVTADIGKELHDTLKKAFQGSKNIKFK